MTALTKPLVFIVEDNSAYRFILGKILQEKGYMVMLFEHGRKAVDMLKYIKPTLIITDIQMPCMDGFEFHEYVKKNFAHYNIPFIYLSSSISESSKDKAQRLGAVEMMDKPVNPAMLRKSITEIIDSIQK